MKRLLILSFDRFLSLILPRGLLAWAIAQAPAPAPSPTKLSPEGITESVTSDVVDSWQR